MLLGTYRMRMPVLNRTQRGLKKSNSRHKFFKSGLEATQREYRILNARVSTGAIHSAKEW